MSVTPWRQTLTRTIARAIASPGGTRGRIMGEAQCGAEAVEFACMAGIYERGGRLLVCSPDTLSRLTKVSAWYALKYMEHAEDDYEAFRQRQPSPLGIKAFGASDASAGDTTLDIRMNELQQESEAAGASRPEGRAARIFQSILDLVFAAMFGHEASHVEAGPPFCAITNRSRVEETGLWAVLMRVNASDELFKASSSVASEVAADRCATRRIRLERAVLDSGPLSARDREFVRRAAADIVSTMLLTHIGAPGAKLLFRVNTGYLYAPLRMLALAGEMNIGEPGSIICGGTAENAAEATQQTLRAQPGDGMMPDEIEHAFPKGVIDAWNRNVSWSVNSFSCR